VHTLSIADVGRLALHRERLDVCEITADVLEQFRSRLENVVWQGRSTAPHNRCSSGQTGVACARFWAT